MGIENLSIASSSFSREGGYGVRVKEGAGVADARLVWSTIYGDEAQASFNVTVTARGWAKGQPYQTAWKTYSVKLPAAQCNELKPYGANGRVWWSVKLSQVGSLVADLYGGSISYATRLVDSSDLEVRVSANWTDEWQGYMGAAVSEEASATLYLGFVPIYRLTKLYYAESNLVVVEYSTTWTRKDDRFAFELFEVADSYDPDDGIQLLSSSGILADDNYWGTVAAIGRIEIPVSKLTQHVKGKWCRLRIRFNASYRPYEMEFATADEVLKCMDMTSCSTPTLALAETGGTVVLATGDSGDVADSPCETVTVKLVGGKYGADQVTVKAGEKASFRFAPFGVPLEFEAVGGNAGGATSKASVRVSAPAVASSQVVVDSIAEDLRCSLKWRKWADYGPSVTAQADFETAKLGGRRRPSAFYGVGGSTQVSFGGYLMGESGEAWERLAEAGDAMCRFPDGRRYAVAPKVTTAYVNDKVLRVNVSGDEVQA